MFSVKHSLIVGGFIVVFFSSVAVAKEIKTRGGTPLDSAAVSKWSITIYPDGRNLPNGSGTAQMGQELYQAQCLSCHGPRGEKGIAPRLAGSLGYTEWSPSPLHALTVGAWPNATTIFDYIRRAMPHTNPKTLSDAEVYALTAYVLNLNGLIEAHHVLNRETLMNVTMPYARKAFSAWELYENSEVRGRPVQGPFKDK